MGFFTAFILLIKSDLSPSNIPAFLMLFMVYGSKTLNILIIFYLLSILGLFYLFDGCFLTKIEKEIDGEDLTIIDPLLEFCNI